MQREIVTTVLVVAGLLFVGLLALGPLLGYRDVDNLAVSVAAATFLGYALGAWR